jgi:protein TonB
MTVAAEPNHPDLRMFAPLDSAAGRRMSPQSVSVAVLLNLAILLLAFRQLHHPLPGPRTIPTFLSPSITLPPSLLKFKADGSGGSNTGAPEVSLGNPPKFAPVPLVPLTAAPVIHPALAVEPALDVQTDMMTRPDLSTMGLLTGTAPSISPGGNGGVGLGTGKGPGAGAGDHGGTGSGHNTGSGGPMIAPQVLYSPEPEFSETARKDKVSGNVLVALTVDAAGRPTDIRILRGLGYGLDEKAVEAVSRYKFKPAMQNGHPVPVPININVDFQIY